MDGKVTEAADGRKDRRARKRFVLPLFARIEEKGAALLITLGVMGMLALIGIAAVLTSNVDISISGSSRRATQAFYLAEAGAERGVNEYLWAGFFDEYTSPMCNLFGWLDSRVGEIPYDSVDLEGTGAYTVEIVSVTDPGPVEPFIECRDIVLRSTGIAGGGAERAVVECSVRMGIQPSGVFDYAYFMNHFGWFAGFPSGGATINGNARANGHFDLLYAYLTVNGEPRYDAFEGSMLDEGGIYAGGFVRPSEGGGYLGMAQYPENRHSYGGVDKSQFDPASILMPNLNDPADYDGDGIVQELNPYYIELANGNLGPDAGKVGIDTNGNGILDPSEVHFVGAYGDEVGESGNVILEGTSAQPIIVEGPVLVTGNLVIKGNIKGQGAFYIGRNMYVAGSIRYKNPPSDRPLYDYGVESPAEYKQRLDEWLDANADKDLVSFQTRENVVVGDFTEYFWQYYITNPGGWLTDYRNDGSEDVGTDAVFGNQTDPDDPYGASEKEGDGKWTVEIYNPTTQERMYQDLVISGGEAQVPTGWQVVPGTGEDVDGDGEYDDPYSYSDFAFDCSWDPDNFLNFDPSKTTYDDFSADLVKYMDGAVYTNHATAGTFWGNSRIRGALVARNESMIVFGSAITIEQDPRLTGTGGTAEDYGIYLARVKGSVSLNWEEL